MRTIHQRIGYLNQMLEDHQGQQRVALDNAYRKLCLIVTDEDGSIQKTIKAGMTKRELYEHLYMMEQILWMLPDPRLTPC
jgi:transposase